MKHGDGSYFFHVPNASHNKLKVRQSKTKFF